MALVVEAQVVLEEVFPVLQRPGSDAVPELLLNGTLDPLCLAVEVGIARPDVGMTDVETVEEAAELGAVVGLNAAQGEGDGIKEPGQGPADGGGGAPRPEAPHPQCCHL